MSHDYANLFSVEDRVVAVTGGGGILCGEMARGLARLGARVAVIGRTPEKLDKVAADIAAAGGRALAVAADVLDPAALAAAQGRIEKELGPVDVLVNGAGGNSPQATTGGTTVADAAAPSFFDLDPEAVRGVFDLNLTGTLLPIQVFGRGMAGRGRGNIVNIASMSGLRPLTKVMGYGAAKAAVINLTQWLAVHLAPAGVRVNAIAPGFFLTEQNRYLLTDRETGQFTPRGTLVVNHTPMRRMGSADELVGALVYLASDASKFVTGTTLAVDGGFSAQSGV